MKRVLISVFMMVVMLLALAGCGARSVNTAAVTPTPEAAGKTVEQMIAEKSEPTAAADSTEKTGASENGEDSAEQAPADNTGDTGSEETAAPAATSAPGGNTGDAGTGGNADPAATPAPGEKTVEQMIAEKTETGPVITVDGVDYRKRSAVHAYLFMGIDKSGEYSSDALIGGQCDVLQLIVVDDNAKTYSRLEISRETNAVVDILDATGDEVGITTEQMINFAHTYGKGDEKSCENVVRAVSRFLGDVEIDGYVSLQYDSVPAMNDTLGGIYVTIEDDFSPYDDTLIKGETMELVGEHSLIYVRARMNMADSSNASRMRRQRTYLNAFYQRLKEEIQDNSSIINDLYNSAKPYMVTDMSFGTISNLVLKGMDYVCASVVTPKGETRSVTYKNGNTYKVFFTDEDDLQRIVLDLFYTPVQAKP